MPTLDASSTSWTSPPSSCSRCPAPGGIAAEAPPPETEAAKAETVARILEGRNFELFGERNPGVCQPLLDALRAGTAVFVEPIARAKHYHDAALAPYARAWLSTSGSARPDRRDLADPHEAILGLDEDHGILPLADGTERGVPRPPRGPEGNGFDFGDLQHLVVITFYRAEPRVRPPCRHRSSVPLSGHPDISN
jgi:hypothetical protein